MSYLDQSLMTGEEVMYRTKLHKISLVVPGLLAFIFGLVGLGAWVSQESIGLTYGGLALLIGGWAYLNYRLSEFGVTTKRVILKTGVLRRRSMEILLNKIESISVDQGPLGRLL